MRVREICVEGEMLKSFLQTSFSCTLSYFNLAVISHARPGQKNQFGSADTARFGPPEFC